MVVTTGKDTSLVHIWEDSFDQTPGDMFGTSTSIADALPLGSNVTLGTNEGSNNAERQFRPGSRQAEYILEAQFDGSWSVEFTLTSPWFLKAMFGEPTTEGVGSTPTSWEHTFDGQFPDSMQLVEQIEHGSGQKDHRILTGCVVSSMEFETDTEGVVEVSMDGAYASEQYVEAISGGSGPYDEFTQPTTDYRPLHFGNAKLYFDEDPTDDARTEQRLIQDASVSLEGNVDMVYELGSRIAADFSPKAIEPELSYTRIVSENASGDNAQDLRDMYGENATNEPADPTMGTSDLEIQLEFNNAETKDDGDDVDKNVITIILEGSLVDSYSRNNVGDPESEIEADVDRLITRAYVVAENETDTAPYAY